MMIHSDTHHPTTCNMVQLDNSITLKPLKVGKPLCLTCDRVPSAWHTEQGLAYFLL